MNTMLNWPVAKSGLIDEFDPRDLLEEDAVLAGIVPDKEVELPESYRVEGLYYEYQGSLPTCGAHATKKVVEKKYETYHNLRLSALYQFVKAGGTERGSTIRGNLNLALSTGLIKNALMPLYEPPTRFDGWLEYAKGQAGDIVPTDSFKIGGYIRIANDPESIKKALVKYGPLVAAVAANSSPGNNYWNDNHTRAKSSDNHLVALVGYEPGYFIRHDSLKKSSTFTGYQKMSDQYQFYSVYAVTELAPDWKEKVEEHKVVTIGEEFKIALSHYGQPRDLWGSKGEQAVALKLRKAFDTSKNRDIQIIANKFWTVYVNAVAYGGYSIKDMLNDAHEYARTGKHAFNLNKLRG